VSHCGGGVPLRKIERLFTYTYSTAPRPSMEARAAPLVISPLLHFLLLLPDIQSEAPFTIYLLLSSPLAHV